MGRQRKLTNRYFGPVKTMLGVALEVGVDKGVLADALWRNTVALAGPDLLYISALAFFPALRLDLCGSGKLCQLKAGNSPH